MSVPLCLLILWTPWLSPHQSWWFQPPQTRFKLPRFPLLVHPLALSHLQVVSAHLHLLMLQTRPWSLLPVAPCHPSLGIALTTEKTTKVPWVKYQPPSLSVGPLIWCLISSMKGFSASMMKSAKSAFNPVYLHSRSLTVLSRIMHDQMPVTIGTHIKRILHSVWRLNLQGYVGQTQLLQELLVSFFPTWNIVLIVFDSGSHSKTMLWSLSGGISWYVEGYTGKVSGSEWLHWYR